MNPPTFALPALSPERLDILRCLKVAAPTDLPMPLKEIAERVGSTSKAVANLLGGLTENGLVVKPEYGKYDVADFVLGLDLDAESGPTSMTAAVAYPTSPDAEALRETLDAAQAEIKVLTARRASVGADFDRLNRQAAEAKDALANGNEPAVSLRDVSAEAAALADVLAAIDLKLAAAGATVESTTEAIRRDRIIGHMVGEAVEAGQAEADYFRILAEVEAVLRRELPRIAEARRFQELATSAFYKLGVELGLPENGRNWAQGVGYVEGVEETMAEIQRRTGSPDGTNTVERGIGLALLRERPLWTMGFPPHPTLSSLARQIVDDLLPRVAKMSA